MSKRIYWNPGHSDKDPGAVGYETERKLNVKVTNFAVEHMKATYICENKMNPGTMGDLSAIAADANKWGANLFVSIHFNAGGGDGWEGLVYSEKNRALGQIFEKYVKAAGQNSRGVKLRPDLAVLRLTNMPAILNEGAFVDNKKDIQDWNEDHELKKLGIAYAEAAAEYLDLEKKSATPAAPEEEADGKCYASKVVAILLGEVGYIEKKSNAQLDSKTANAGYNNYTKYARDLDKIGYFYNTPKQGYPYCDVTFDWAMVQAFGVKKAMELLCQPKKSAGAGCQQSAMYYKNKGRLIKKNPKPGDQIFFWNAAKTSRGHTGGVIKVDSKYVYTVEGNTSSADGVVVANGGGVWQKRYPLNHPRIADYGRPAYDEEPTTGGMPELEIESGNTYKVKAGDSLWKIAAEKLGDGRRHKEIMELNGLTSTVLRVGMILQIPVDEKPAPAIKKGDTVKLKSGAETYDGKKLWSGVYKRKHKVKEVKGDRAVITYCGVTVAAVHTADLQLV